ncbi:hypothetical protein [Streptomyces sp. 7N604]|uniref:hypothetical protein n=1 Tax=Streptomyces sp. 7N604 TaxID=3457415 RepID=UPI003FD199A2
MRPRIRRNVIVVGIASASLVGWFASPAAHATHDRPKISDCVGKENGYDRSGQLSNKEWARAENHSEGYGKYATCRFVIKDKSKYVDLSQRVVSDTYGACEGPAWGVELTAGDSLARSKAKSREKQRLKRHEHFIERTVSAEISATIAEVLTISLGRSTTVGDLWAREHSRTKGESTEYTDTKTKERTISVDIPEGKRAYFQYAPWLQKSSGYLEMSYWGGEPGDRNNRVVKHIDLTTHTPVLKDDKKPRLDYQTRWLDCPTKKSARKTRKA